MDSATRGATGDGGRFAMVGAVTDWGAEVAVYSERSQGYVVRMTLTGQRGALVVEELLRSEGHVLSGTWTVVSGTGIYRATRGFGSSRMTRTSTGVRRVLTGTL